MYDKTYRKANSFLPSWLLWKANVAFIVSILELQVK